jgi:O-antigen/teichoic acid export membrane protein
MTGLFRWRPGGYLRNSGQLLLWMAVRAVAQAVLVVALSRLFGASIYGKFVTVVSIPSFLMPFAGLGLSGILLRDGARNPEQLDGLLASSLHTWTWSTVVCAVLGCVAGMALLTEGIPMLAALALIAAEIVSTSLVDLLARAEQAAHRAGRFGAINAGLPVARLVALLGYWKGGHHTLGGWMWAYAGAGIAYTVAMLVWLKPQTQTNADTPRLRIREGLPFGTAALALRLQAEFNKPLLARIGFDQAADMGVAQRAVDLASLPLVALQEVLWPRLYSSDNGHMRLRTAALSLVAIGLLVGAALWVCAGLVPWLLGADFSPTVPVIRWLAWLPVLQLLRNFSNFNVVVAHRTDIVGTSYLTGSLVAVGLAATLIPRYGMAGALATAYLSETSIIAIQQFLLRGPTASKSRERTKK